jgi:CheY-like chemotaxis protein
MNAAPAPASILIVEDESIIAADIESSLKDLGYNVAGKTDCGERALELAADNKPNLVLMDIMLRGDMRGTAAAKVLREEFKIPVVMLTGNTDMATFRHALGSAPYGYVLKPFENRELHIAIEIALDKHRAELAREALIKQLEEALQQVRMLQEIVPVCAWCRKIRDDDGYWQTVEKYLSTHFKVGFTHGVCPECFKSTLADIKRDSPSANIGPARADC